MSGRALVLAGGGYAARAWEIGLITGMLDAGVDLRTADVAASCRNTERRTPASHS